METRQRITGNRIPRLIMPATTWLRVDEYLRPTGNKMIDNTLGQLRTITGKDWRIEKHQTIKGHLWWKHSADLFCLYLGVGDTPLGSEFQIINFYRDGTDWSINHYVPAELVVAYMFGACVRPDPRTTSE
jgi:hypothetical protein